MIFFSSDVIARVAEETPAAWAALTLMYFCLSLNLIDWPCSPSWRPIQPETATGPNGSKAVLSRNRGCLTEGNYAGITTLAAGLFEGRLRRPRCTDPGRFIARRSTGAAGRTMDMEAERVPEFCSKRLGRAAFRGNVSNCPVAFREASVDRQVVMALAGPSAKA
jgi:hypothetical protein